MSVGESAIFRKKKQFSGFFSLIQLKLKGFSKLLLLEADIPEIIEWKSFWSQVTLELTPAQLVKTSVSKPEL